MNMTDLPKLFCALAVATGFLAGCAPQPMPGYAQTGQENLTAQVRRLQGDVSSQERSLEELRRELDLLSRKVDEQQQEIARLWSSGNASTAHSVAVPVPMSQPMLSTSPADTQALPPELEGSPTDVYLRAFGNYANGRYAAAILGFEAFLDQFPNNSYASNAHFWMADSYFKQQQLTVALREFELMAQRYPQAPKAPDALLKIATIALQLDQPDQARDAMERLRRNYPDSAADKKAQQLVLP